MKYRGKEIELMTALKWNGKSRDMLVWDIVGKEPTIECVVGFTVKGSPISYNSHIVGKHYQTHAFCADIPPEDIEGLTSKDTLVDGNYYGFFLKTYEWNIGQCKNNVLIAELPFGEYKDTKPFPVAPENCSTIFNVKSSGIDYPSFKSAIESSITDINLIHAIKHILLDNMVLHRNITSTSKMWQDDAYKWKTNYNNLKESILAICKSFEE